MWPCVAGAGRCTRACVRAGRTPLGAARSLSAAPRVPSLRPLWIPSHNRLSLRVQTLRFSLLPYVLLCVSPASLSDPQQPDTHLAHRSGWGPERPPPRVRSFQAGAGGCGSAGRRWREGTRSVAAPEPEAAPPPIPRSENGERGGERAESKEEVIVINECHN